MDEVDRTGMARESRIALAILLVAMVVASFLYLSNIDLAEDDAYITFRYAANARSGHGLVYNEGERVCGVSSPFYLVIVTVASSILRSTPVDLIALRLNLLPLLASGLFGYLFIRRITLRPLISALMGAAVMLDARMLTHASDGMESSWFITWLLATLWAIDLRKPILIGALCGIAMLTRPEGILLLPIVAVLLRDDRKRLLMALGVFVAAILPWTVFATLYYGTPIPQSLIAKAKPLYPLAIGHALGSMVEVLHWWWIVGVAVASAIALRAYPRAQSLVAFFWLLIAFYAATNPLMMPWYYAPLQGLGLLIITLAIFGSGAMLLGTAQSWAVIATVLVLCLQVLLPYDMLSLHDRVRSLERQRLLPYRELAERLNAAAKPGDVVATPEIGALGYYYHGPILDGCGLVSRATLPYLPVHRNERLLPEVGALPPKLIQDQRPPWIVTILCFIRQGLYSSEWFQANYEPVDAALLPGELWGERGVLVFRRKS